MIFIWVLQRSIIFLFPFQPKIASILQHYKLYTAILLGWRYLNFGQIDWSYISLDFQDSIKSILLLEMLEMCATERIMDKFCIFLSLIQMLSWRMMRFLKQHQTIPQKAYHKLYPKYS